MSISKLILVTHKKPDLDAVTSIYLWLKANQIRWDSGEDVYEMRFVNPGQRLEYSQDNEEGVTVIHFDTGGAHDDFNFDHHQLNSREISATGLVWNRFYKPGQFPALDELTELVNHYDNGIQYETSNLDVRHMFSAGSFLAGANKDHSALFNFYMKLLSGSQGNSYNKLNTNQKDNTHTMVMGFSLIESFQANYYETKIHDITTEQQIEIFNTQFGKTVVLNNIPGDASFIRSYMRKYNNGKRGSLVNTCVVEFAHGPIGIIICIDPDQEKSIVADNHQSDNDTPNKISLSAEMEELYANLKRIDPSPQSNIYLHYSRFSLFINRSQTIRLKDVLNLVRIKID